MTNDNNSTILPPVTTEPRQPLDQPSLHAYLLRHLDIHESARLSQFKQGQSNPTYLLRFTATATPPLVLRKKPEGLLLDRSAHNIRREFEVMRSLGGHSVPVPRMVAYCEDPLVIGTEFYLMSFVEGRVLTDPLLSDLDGWARSRCWFQLVDVLSQLHSVPVSSVAHVIVASTVSSHNNLSFYSRQIRTLGKVSRKQASVSGTPSLPDLDAMLDWFTKNQPRDNESTIVHGDYKLDNVIFDSRTFDIRAVIDWELCTIGHPLSDLANMLIPFLMDRDEFGVVQRGLRDCVDPSIPSLEVLLKRYCSNTGRQYPIQDWRFCMAFSLFRMSVILQGVAARINTGQATSAQAEMYASMAVPSAMKSWSIIRGDLKKSKL
eukprot:Partr_v1_DN28155_c0_g1_i1_m55989 putative Acyl-CoA dehydrogenase family, member